VEVSGASVLELSTLEEVEYVAPHCLRWLSPQAVFQLTQAVDEMVGGVERTIGREAVVVIRDSEDVCKMVPSTFSHGQCEKDVWNSEIVDHRIHMKLTVVEVGIPGSYECGQRCRYIFVNYGSAIIDTPLYELGGGRWTVIQVSLLLAEDTLRVLVVTEFFKLEVGPCRPIPVNTESRIRACKLSFDVFSVGDCGTAVVIIVLGISLRSFVVPTAIREKIWEEKSLHVWVSKAYRKAGAVAILDEASH